MRPPIWTVPFKRYWPMTGAREWTNRRWRILSGKAKLILVRVQAETNNPRPCTDAPHPVLVRSQPWQAGFQASHHPGHVGKHPVRKFLLPKLIPQMFLRIEFRRIAGQAMQTDVLRHHQRLGDMRTAARHHHDDEVFRVGGTDLSRKGSHLFKPGPPTRKTSSSWSWTAP